MNYLSLTAVFCCLCSTLFALPSMPVQMRIDRDDVLERMASVTRADAPDAHSVSLGTATYVAYDADGLHRDWYESWQKALTEDGAKSLREMDMWFKEGFSSTEFQLAEIHRPDGTVIPVDIPANTAEATDNNNVDANIYDPTQKRLVLSIPEIRVGDTLHLIVAQEHTKVRIPNTFCDISVFENFTEPTFFAVSTVDAPKELPLRSVAVLNEIPGTVTSSQTKLPNGGVRYRWEARDIPQSFGEENMPPKLQVMQRASYSTFASWEEVSKWYWTISERHMKMTPAIKDKVAKLIAGKKTDAEKISAIFGFVAQEVRYMGVIAEKEAPGFEPHDIALTFDNRYGVCRDKGVLLVAMLREAGFNAYPVLINAGAKVAKETPMPFFNHAITAIETSDRVYTLIDPTDDTARAELPAYLGDCSYLVCRPDGATLDITPVQPAEENRLTAATEATLEPNSTLKFTTSLTFGGINDNVYRGLFAQLSETDLRTRLDGMLKGAIPGSELLSCTLLPKNVRDISQPLTLKMTARVPDFAVTDSDGRTLVRLPFVTRGFGLINFLIGGLDQPKRKYPWVLTAPCGVKETVTLRGFDSLGEPTLLPEDPILVSNGATYDITCRRNREAGTYTLTRNLELSHKTYSPEDYLALRRFYERYTRIERFRSLFTRSDTRDADARVKEQHTDVELLADGTRTVRTVRRTRALSYHGKKSIAEINLWHNPAFQTLTIAAAEVTTAKGDKLSATEREINELDDDAAAGAPRYAWNKRTIIALPTVEIGAETFVDSTVTDKEPRPFSEVVVFGSTYPCDVQSYTLTVPAARADTLVWKTFNIGETDFESNKETLGEGPDARVRYTWTARSLKKVPSESATPAGFLTLPTLYVSEGAASAPEAVLPAVADAVNQRIRADRDAVAKATDKLLDTLKDDSDEAILRAINAFVAKRIRSAGPSWSSMPDRYAFGPARVLKDGYANRLDRLTLQLAMLREAGIRAELVFRSSIQPSDLRAFPDFYKEADSYWGNWTTPYIRLRDGRLIGDGGELDEPGAVSFREARLMDRRGRVSEAITPDNLLSHPEKTVRIVLSANGDAVISEDTYLYGLSAGTFRIMARGLTPEIRTRSAAALANDIAPGAVPNCTWLTDTDNYPVRNRLSVIARAFGTRQGDYLSVPLQGISGRLYGLRGSRRTNPVYSGAVTTDTSVVTEIWIPPECTVIMRPAGTEIALPGGGTWYRRLTETVNPLGWRILRYETGRTVCDAAVLPPWKAPALQELDRRLSAPTESTLLLRFGKQAPAAK